MLNLTLSLSLSLSISLSLASLRTNLLTFDERKGYKNTFYICSVNRLFAFYYYYFFPKRKSFGSLMAVTFLTDQSQIFFNLLLSSRGEKKVINPYLNEIRFCAWGRIMLLLLSSRIPEAWNAFNIKICLKRWAAVDDLVVRAALFQGWRSKDGGACTVSHDNQIQ